MLAPEQPETALLPEPPAPGTKHTLIRLGLMHKRMNCRHQARHLQLPSKPLPPAPHGAGQCMTTLPTPGRSGPRPPVRVTPPARGAPTSRQEPDRHSDAGACPPLGCVLKSPVQPPGRVNSLSDKPWHPS